MKIQTFVFNPFYENTYVLWDDTQEAIIVDPGCYEKYEKEELLEFIKSSGLNVKLILNTHCHIDHVLGNYWAKETYKCPLWIPEHEQNNHRAVTSYAPNWGIQHYTEAQPDYLVKEYDTISFGNVKLSSIEAPGHSPGHLVYYWPQGNILIGGDVLFKGSIGRTDLPGGNHQQLLDNIREKIYTLPGETVVYPGHGPTTTVELERTTNPFVKA